MLGPYSRGRGQAETISVILLLTITVAGILIILTLGTVAFEDNVQTTALAGTEHTMTQFDSRAAVVALGESDSQEVDLGQSEGAYQVREDAGSVNITHFNHSGSGNVEVIYNGTLGALVYETGGTEIAYQGGGVWRKEGNGSTMVSPPELHYKSATLTFPIIRVTGTGSSSGRVTGQITKQATTRIYPNTSSTYSISGDSYQNPIQAGDVTITVQSEYYRAWETYFSSRTDGNITVDHANNTVSATLDTTSHVGDFDMPADGNSIQLNGLAQNGHSIQNFSIELYPDDTDAADYANLQWSLHEDQGNQRFELHLREAGVNDNGSTACTERDVAATIYYSDSNGDPYHGWHNDTAFRTECYDRDNDGSDDETRLQANLTGPAKMTMEDLSSSQLQHFNPSGDTRNTSAEFSEHSSNVNWEATTFSDTGDDTTTIGNLTRHYLALMGPDVSLTVDDKSSDTVNEDASSGVIENDGSGQFLTFLHITDNEIIITLE